MSEVVTCPKCHKKGPNHAAFRQGPGVIDGVEQHIVDIGYRCTSCGHEWGFEYFTHNPLGFTTVHCTKCKATEQTPKALGVVMMECPNCGGTMKAVPYAANVR